MESKCRVDISIGAALLYPVLYFLDDGGWFSVFLPGIAVHELGHWLAIRLAGGRVTSIRIDVAGLCLDTAMIGGKAEEAVCVFAGPAAGMAWCCIASLFPFPWAGRCAGASLALTVFNLLPALPLDGGRLLLILTEDLRAVRICSAAVALILAAAGLRLKKALFLIPAAFIMKSVFSP